MWGKPEDGPAADKTLHTTLFSALARLFADYGGQPGASISIADAALVTDDNRTPLRDTVFLTRFPATDSECGRLIAETVARNQGEEVGGLAQP